MAAGEELAEMMRRIREAEDGTPEREAYLQKLAAQIREGTYKVDADELARKLLRELAD
jgi:anti-sigma28 factor (negative regulator of flagellin synthesis)